LILDRQLSILYKRIKRVTRGDLLDRQRLLDIWYLNFGPGRHLADEYFAVNSRMQRVSLAAITAPIDDAEWDFRARPFSGYGIEVDLGALRHPTAVQAGLERYDSYKMQCMKTGLVVAQIAIPSGPRDQTVMLPPATARIGCDRLRVFPGSNEQRSLGYLQIAAEYDPTAPLESATRASSPSSAPSVPLQ
jgi:hypothetical protein